MPQVVSGALVPTGARPSGPPRGEPRSGPGPCPGWRRSPRSSPAHGWIGGPDLSEGRRGRGRAGAAGAGPGRMPRRCACPEAVGPHPRTPNTSRGEAPALPAARRNGPAPCPGGRSPSAPVVVAGDGAVAGVPAVRSCVAAALPLPRDLHLLARRRGGVGEARPVPGLAAVDVVARPWGRPLDARLRISRPVGRPGMRRTGPTRGEGDGVRRTGAAQPRVRGLRHRRAKGAGRSPAEAARTTSATRALRVGARLAVLIHSSVPRLTLSG